MLPVVAIAKGADCPCRSLRHQSRCLRAFQALPLALHSLTKYVMFERACELCEILYPLYVPSGS